LTPVLSCRLIFNLRQVNNRPTDTGIPSYLLNQLQEDKDIEANIVHGEKIPFEGASFGNLNLDAFDKVLASPTSSDSSMNGTSQATVNAPSFEGARLHDVHPSFFDHSDSSTDYSQMSSSTHENDIEEVR
jgi:hypothetical protein